MLKKQPEFKKWNVSMLVAAFIAQFIYSEMPSDIYSTYYTYLTQNGTLWTRSNMTLSTTLASFAAIPLMYFVADLLAKSNSRLWAACSTIAVGLCTIVIGLAAGTNFPVFWIALFINNIAARIEILAIQGMVTNWYISTRGKVMGIYTIAAPLGTAFFPNFLIHMVELTNPNVNLENGELYNFAPIWTAVGIVIIVFGAVLYFITRSKPEVIKCSDGTPLYPDGIIRSKEEIAVLNKTEESIWTNSKLLKTKETWLVSIGNSGWVWVMNGFLSLFVVVMLEEFGIEPTTSVWYLTAASLLGIVLSFLWGVIDDKFGTPIACRGLSISYLFMSLSMLLAVITKFQPIIIISVIGIACAAGGIPNLTPSVFGYVFGRKQFMYANKVICPLTALLAAPSAYVFTKIQEVTCSFIPVYAGCVAAACVSIICFSLLNKSYDPERQALRDAVVVGKITCNQTRIL